MNKKANKKGFTIMEMLIVVAIIAVLAAIAIPTFSSALEKSKQAADVANVRAAYAEVMVEYLTDDTAIPESKAEFIKKIGTGVLNYEDKLSYGVGTGNKDITYAASKLEKNTYTWELPAAPKTPDPAQNPAG